MPGQLGLAALLQMAVAATVAARVTRLGSLHGLFAASVAGCMMAIGAIGRLPALRLGGVGLSIADVEPWMIWYQASLFTTWGPLLTLPVAMLTSTVAAHVRSRLTNTSRPELSQRRNDPHRPEAKPLSRSLSSSASRPCFGPTWPTRLLSALAHATDPSAYLPADAELPPGFDLAPSWPPACRRRPRDGCRTYLGTEPDPDGRRRSLGLPGGRPAMAAGRGPHAAAEGWAVEPLPGLGDEALITPSSLTVAQAVMVAVRLGAVTGVTIVMKSVPAADDGALTVARLIEARASVASKRGNGPAQFASASPT